MSQVQTQKQNPKPIEIKFFYSSCTGRTSRNRFNVAYNTKTGETKYLDKLVKNTFKGPEHKGVGCSRVIQIMVESKEIEKLEKQGWVFKEIELFRGSFRKATWWTLTREIEFVKSARDEKGWYDLIKIDGELFKAYRETIILA